MGFSQAIASCMGKYANFQGRATRGEYWWFYLFQILLTWGASIVGSLTLGDSGNRLAAMIYYRNTLFGIGPKLTAVQWC